MAAWGEPTGEALHTGTFFGNPLACAAALAALDVIEQEQLCARAAEVGAQLQRVSCARRVGARVRAVRGVGLMVGVEFDVGRAMPCVGARAARARLHHAAGGRRACVLSLTPPLTIELALLEGFVDALDRALGRGCCHDARDALALARDSADRRLARWRARRRCPRCAARRPARAISAVQSRRTRASSRVSVAGATTRCAGPRCRPTCFGTHAWQRTRRGATCACFTRRARPRRRAAPTTCKTCRSTIAARVRPRATRCFRIASGCGS